MASNNLGKMTASATLEASQFLKGMNTIQEKAKATGETIRKEFTASLSRLASPLTTPFQTASSFFTGLGAGGAASSVISNIQAQVEATFDLLNAQFRLSRAFNLSSESAAAYLNLGRRVGMNSQELQGSLQIVARHLGEARLALSTGETGGPVVRSLELLGLNAQEFLQLRFDEQIEEIGPRLRGIADSTDRAAIAFGILGRHGEALLPFLERAGELGRIRSLVTQTGEAMPGLAGQARQAMRDFNDSVANAESRWTGFKNQIAVGLGQLFGTIERRGFFSTLFGGGMFEESAARAIGTGSDPEKEAAKARKAGKDIAGFLGTQNTQSLAQQLQLRNAIDEATKAIAAQIPAWGEVGTAAERARLVARGATDEMLSKFDQIAGILNKLRAAQEQFDDLNARRSAVVVANRSPFQNLVRDWERLQGLGLNKQQMALAAGRLFSQMPEAMAELRGPGVLETGTSEAASVILDSIRQQRGGGVQERMLNALQAMKEQQQQMLEIGREALQVFQELFGGGGGDLVVAP